MKKIFTLSIMFMLAVSAMAQNYAMQITKVDGSVVLLPASKVEMVQFVESEDTGVAGTYEGTITMAMKYGTYSYDEQSITLTDIGANMVDLSYDGSLGVADIEVTVSVTDDGYSLDGEGYMQMDNHAGGYNDYACTVSGTISSDLSDFAIALTCPSVMGGTVFTLAPTPSAADVIAGDYSGTMTMAMAYGTYSYEDQTVTITSEGETVAITYSGDLGNCDLTGLVVSEEDGNYVIAETEVVFSMGMSADSVKEYACIVSATISSDLSDYAISFYLPSVMGGTTLTLVPAAE